MGMRIACYLLWPRQEDFAEGERVEHYRWVKPHWRVSSTARILAEPDYQRDNLADPFVSWLLTWICLSHRTKKKNEA